MEQKKKPHRSKAFLAFCHEHMRPAPCAWCEQGPWTELHHWGDDGGMGMKPGDLEVVRLCVVCHGKFGFKKRALLLAKGMTRGIADRILACFQKDAAALHVAYIIHMENGRPPVQNGCARDDLEKYIRHTLGYPSTDTCDWLMRWADRRAVELFTAMEEGGGDGD